MMCKVFYSIIIPAYNVEQYIEQCIQSVLTQSFADYEILVVDDGSVDNTGMIVKKMAEKYSAISAIQIIHSGAGAARNAGLAKAQGKYVIFLDADDYWTNPCLLKHLHSKLWRRMWML